MFTAGQPLVATQCVDIGIVDDDNVEGEHEFTVEIVSVYPSSVFKCSLTTTTVHITDNDCENRCIYIFSIIIIIVFYVLVYMQNCVRYYFLMGMQQLLSLSHIRTQWQTLV